VASGCFGIRSESACARRAQLTEGSLFEGCVEDPSVASLEFLELCGEYPSTIELGSVKKHLEYFHEREECVRPLRHRRY
jgi:hypothetical protein